MLNFDLQKELHWPWGEPKPQTPAYITDFWTDTALTQAGRAAVARVWRPDLFYAEENGKPVTVEGTLDDLRLRWQTTTTRCNTAPEKKFVFPPDQLPKHCSKSKLGRSYSVWLPWTR